MPSHFLATARLALTASDDSGALELEVSSHLGEVGRKRCLDVYRDPIPKAEARKAHAIMLAIHARVSDLLKEWPDHPSLLKVRLSHMPLVDVHTFHLLCIFVTITYFYIVTILNRMCGFSMSDCLTKYLTAFEMLLTNMQVNMAPPSLRPRPCSICLLSTLF